MRRRSPDVFTNEKTPALGPAPSGALAIASNGNTPNMPASRRRATTRRHSGREQKKAASGVGPGKVESTMHSCEHHNLRVLVARCAATGTLPPAAGRSKSLAITGRTSPGLASRGGAPGVSTTAVGPSTTALPWGNKLRIASARSAWPPVKAGASTRHTARTCCKRSAATRACARDMEKRRQVASREEETSAAPRLNADRTPNCKATQRRSERPRVHRARRLRLQGGPRPVPSTDQGATHGKGPLLLARPNQLQGR